MPVSLERRVRALNATTFGSKDSGLNRAGAFGGGGGGGEDMMPGTNVHATAGANPIWTVEEDGDEDGVNKLAADLVVQNTISL